MSPFFLLIFGFFFGDNYGWTLPSVRPAGATGAEPRAERSGALVDGYVIKSAMPHCTALQNIYLAHDANLEQARCGTYTRCTLRIPPFAFVVSRILRNFTARNFVELSQFWK